MLIHLKYLCDKYNFIPKGIIHVGAHMGEESEVYSELGIENVVWVEANEKIFQHLCQKLSHKKSYKFLNYLVSDIDDKDYEFHITNNGESSSLLELEEHKIEHPHIFVTETVNLKSKTLDSIISSNNIDTNNYNLLNLDIQGAELLALKGSVELLNKIDYIYSEVNIKHLYKDCALIDEMDVFLKKFGFERVEEKILNHGWGDAFYMKKIIC